MNDEPAETTGPEGGTPPSEATEAPPEAEALFLVITNGPRAGAQVVAGVAGVQAAFLRILWRGPREAVPNDLAALAASVEDPAAWAAHGPGNGPGDGRPFWHWQTGLPDGSVSAQRITEPLPLDPRAAAEAMRRSAAFGKAMAELADCAAILRREARRDTETLRLTSGEPPG
jgi:hypothetical protein